MKRIGCLVAILWFAIMPATAQIIASGSATPALNLTGSTLAPNVTASSLTSLGTIVSLTTSGTMTAAAANFSGAITASTTLMVAGAGFGQLGILNAAGNATATFQGNGASVFWISGKSVANGNTLSIGGNGGTDPASGAININSSGGVAIPSMTSSAQTNVVCYNTGTGLLTYQAFATGCVTSSERFKDNIEPLSSSEALATIRALRPVAYSYRPEADLGKDRHMGFTAEQVASVDPELATYDSDGKPRAVKYQEMSPRIVAAIQEQQKQINALRARRWCLAGWCW